MSKKIGRNDPCPCGSGKKYKKCCLDSKSVPINKTISKSEGPVRRNPTNFKNLVSTLMNR